MTTRCVLCNWPLDDDHAWNVHCALANAENDQLMAEVREAEQQPDDDPELTERMREVARETLALIRFNRDVTR